jgi:hypothetical protein
VLQATRQLAVVRDINERQAQELADAAEEAKRLREQVGGQPAVAAGLLEPKPSNSSAVEGHESPA